ncbi:MAG: PVC-type heme-binding CxxCH protein [Balneolales bacterium]
MKVLNPSGSALLFSLCLLSMSHCSGGGSGQTGTLVSPLDGPDALSSIEVMEGFRVELFAGEPLIEDPAAMEVDEQGRVYVVEMRSYPLDGSGLGRVKLLEDSSGDGLPDSYTVFADSLMFPNGIMRWKQGVLVTDAPHLYYLEDTTGDGIADKKEIMLTGFARSNPQHNFNTPLYGLDNWIYLANNGTIGTDTYADLFGDRGSEVGFYGREDGVRLPPNAGGRNVRFRPGTRELEMCSASAQFGHTFDGRGRHFLNSNSSHHYHEVLGKKYAGRNPHLPGHSVVHYTPEHGNAADVYPITMNPEHQLLTDRGVFTSASGLTWYLGGAFPEVFDRVTFTAESVHNLVHADVVEDEGIVSTARRLTEGREFLASTDAWFRPVNFYIGPDGALYILDYYRPIVEHPQWMDEQTLQTRDLYEATSRGRIYRVVPADMDGPRWTNSLSLDTAPVRELAGHLESRNIWWRKNAQRLLVDRNDPSAAEALAELVVESDHPAARLHALWTLEGLGRLGDDLIARGLEDEDAGVRENAVKLAEGRLEANAHLAGMLTEMAGDPDAGVRYQLALTLGDLTTDRAGEIREQMLFDEIEDPWMQIAILSGKSIRPDLMQRSLQRLGGEQTPGRRLFFDRLASMIGNQGEGQEIRDLMGESLANTGEEREWWSTAVLSGLAGALQYLDMDPHDFSGESHMAVGAFFETRSNRVREAVMQLIMVLGIPEEDREPTLQQAAGIAADGNKDDSFRADAIRMISMLDPLSYEEELKSYTALHEPAAVQQAAVRSLGKIPGLPIGEFLLERWGTMTPGIRDAAVNVLMQEPERMELLLDAVERNEVRVSTIGWNRRVVLMRDTPAGGGIRERARSLLSENPAARSEMVDAYRESQTLTGNVENGKSIYRAQCSSCHQVRGEEGIAFGPDLGTVRHWRSPALIAKILDPGRSVADGYEMWIVERSSGGSLAGVMVSETSGSVTLRNADGSETSIPRTEIESLTSSKTSAMPAELHRVIDKQGMADLIAYIRQI